MKDNEYSELIIHCSVCGKNEELHWDFATNAECYGYRMCFICNFWRNHFAYDIDRSLRIEGNHYIDCGSVDDLSEYRFIGHGGAKFKIKKSDGTIIETNNLWHQGEIPKEWKDKLTDNAEFMNRGL
jgi:hypothetical protein